MPDTGERIVLYLPEGILERGDLRVRLRPKTMDVLKVLIDRHGSFVRQDELRSLVWATRYGNDAGPKQCIRELRRLLGDTSANPRFIETIGRAGYRLLTHIDVIDDGRMLLDAPPICVGRETELTALSATRDEAARGRSSITLIHGEAGAGKTRLVETFLTSLPDPGRLWIGRGQCIPHAQAREPYGPLMEVIGALANGHLGAQVRALLSEFAPLWCRQIAGLGTALAHSAPYMEVVTTPPHQMVRELSDFLEHLGQCSPGVLVLEDLHWADASTLAWLSAWGMRRRSTRLMVIATLRSEGMQAEALVTALRVLERQPQVRSLHLRNLDGAAVADFLKRRFPGHAFPDMLADELARRTVGHAILVDTVVEQWRDRDIHWQDGQWVLGRNADQMIAGIASDVRSLLVAQIESLGFSERRLLEGASVAGLQFSAAALTESSDVEEVERQLEDLASGNRFIERAGPIEWPNGTVAASYVFRHALHREAIYDLIPAANRQGLHRRIGTRLESAYGADAHEVAPALADHFERAGVFAKAALHRGRAGGAALHRGALRDAVMQFRHALSLLRRSPDPADPATKLEVLQGLGASLIVSEGFTAADLPEVYRQAYGLAHQLDDPVSAVPALAGLWNYHLSCGETAKAAELATSLQALSQDATPALRMAGRNASGITEFFLGNPRACLPHIAAVLAENVRIAASSTVALFGEDPLVVCHQYAACVSQLLGDAAAAEAYFQAGMDAASGQPFGRAQMLWAGTLIAREQAAPELVLARAELLADICKQSAILFWSPIADLMAGWAIAMRGDPGGLVRLRRGMEAYDQMNVKSTRPYQFGLLAEASVRHGEMQHAYCALSRGLRVSRTTGERWYEAELYRLRATLFPQSTTAAKALRRAVDIAQRQGATAFSSRAQEQLDALL